MKKTDVAVIGGDTRQFYLANELQNKNYTVFYYGEKNELLSKKIILAKSLPEILHNCSVIICPVPFAKNKSEILGLEEIESLSISCLLDNLTENHLLFGGVLPDYLITHCQNNRIFYEDIAKNNDFALLNSVLTAEGAISYAITESKICLHDSRCLILGFGRCGKAIQDRLFGFHTEITVCSKSDNELCEALVSGSKTLHLKNLINASMYDFIFNTIPAPVITKQVLGTLSRDVTIIDIASAPGGVDFETAKQLNINARLYLGIPGKISPQSAGRVIADVIIKILEERSS